jgi:PAS domain-containing protein
MKRGDSASIPLTRSLVERKIQEAAASGTELRIEWQVLDPNSSERWLMSVGRPLRDAHSKVNSYIGIVIDITERKKIESTLRESEERLRLIQKSSGIGSWKQDLGGGPSVWSPEEYTILGLDPATCLPSHKTWKSTVFSEDLEWAEANVRKATATKGTLDFDYRVVLSDESNFIVGMPLAAGQASTLQVSWCCGELTLISQSSS